MTTFNGFEFNEGTTEEKKQMIQALSNHLRRHPLSVEEVATLLVETMATTSEIVCEADEDDENTLQNIRSMVSDLHGQIESFIN